jgi:hypothetical protein
VPPSSSACWLRTMPICRLADAEAGKNRLNFLAQVGNPLLSQSPAGDIESARKGRHTETSTLARADRYEGTLLAQRFLGVGGAEPSEARGSACESRSAAFPSRRGYLDWRGNFSHGGGVCEGLTPRAASSALRPCSVRCGV